MPYWNWNWNIDDGWWWWWTLAYPPSNTLSFTIKANYQWAFPPDLSQSTEFAEPLQLEDLPKLLCKHLTLQLQVALQNIKDVCFHNSFICKTVEVPLKYKNKSLSWGHLQLEFICMSNKYKSTGLGNISGIVTSLLHNEKHDKRKHSNMQLNIEEIVMHVIHLTTNSL